MTLTSEDAARVLRTSTVTQITGELIDVTGCRCAVGVLGGEELGLKTSLVLRVGYDVEVKEQETVFQGAYYNCDKRIGECYGMDYRLVIQIINWNDECFMSFQQIADEIDRWADGDFSNIDVDPQVAEPLTVIP